MKRIRLLASIEFDYDPEDYPEGVDPLQAESQYLGDRGLIPYLENLEEHGRLTRSLQAAFGWQHTVH